MSIESLFLICFSFVSFFILYLAYRTYDNKFKNLAKRLGCKYEILNDGFKLWTISGNYRNHEIVLIGIYPEAAGLGAPRTIFPIEVEVWVNNQRLDHQVLHNVIEPSLIKDFIDNFINNSK